MGVALKHEDPSWDDPHGIFPDGATGQQELKVAVT